MLGIAARRRLAVGGSSPTIIVGMHRSGTSMLVRLLAALGVHAGTDLSMNAESPFYQGLNRALLRDAGGRWCDIGPVRDKMTDRKFLSKQASHLENTILSDTGIGSFFSRGDRMRIILGLKPGPWGWKDPRNSLVLPIWLRVFPSAKIVHVIRDGVDVAISLHRRETGRRPNDGDLCADCDSLAHCHRLWEEYVLACRQDGRTLGDKQYLEIRYELMLESPAREMGRVVEFLGMRVGDTRLSKATALVNVTRLGNSEARCQYRQQIEMLPASSVMQELGYAM
ncbi:sulfotransferase [Chloroflexota bacterium]